MVGILLGSHGPFAGSILESAELIFGVNEQISSACLSLDSSLEEYYALLNTGVKKLDSGDGVLILVDIMGGTPSNQALRLCIENENCELVTGLNMSMLLQVLAEREGKTLKELAEAACEAGKEGIDYISKKLRENR